MYGNLRKLNKASVFFIALLLFKSMRWAFRVSMENLSYNDLKILRVDKGCLMNKMTQLKLTDDMFNKTKGCLGSWKSLSSYKGITEFKMEGDTLRIKIDGLYFIIDHSGTLSILDEIFHERLYDIRINEELIVLDVGMNVGVASLFFAQWSNVKVIYGFEPLETTFDQAVANFKENKGVSDKIIPTKKGLGLNDEIISVPFKAGGSAGFVTNKEFLEIEDKNTNEEVEVEIASFLKVFNEIRTLYPDHRFLLKLDCEGEEYNIIKELEVNNLFSHISCIAMEWHVKGNSWLCEILQKNGFSIFNLSRNDLHPPVGMIYAFNNS